MTFEEFNPDSMEREDLMAFWQLTNRARPVAEARKFFGRPPYQPGYVKVFKGLGAYAGNKATAMRLRVEGRIQMAQQYEQICERIYQDRRRGPSGERSGRERRQFALRFGYQEQALNLVRTARPPNSYLREPKLPTHHAQSDGLRIRSSRARSNH